MLTTQDSNKAMGCSGGSDVGVDDDDAEADTDDDVDDAAGGGDDESNDGDDVQMGSNSSLSAGGGVCKFHTGTTRLLAAFRVRVTAASRSGPNARETAAVAASTPLPAWTNHRM